VGVVDYDDDQDPTAGIVSRAYDAELNNAYTGVLAGAELTEDTPPTLLASLLEQFSNDPPIDLSSYISGLVIDLGAINDFVSPGSVYVTAFGQGGEAMILSDASGGLENTAETVVAAPGEVVVANDGFGASIESYAGTSGSGALDKATTRIYASEVAVDDMSVIEAETGSEQESVYDYLLTLDGEVVEVGDATLIIQDYDEATDLPDCPECPCLEDGPIPPPIPPAPLGVAPIPALEEIVFGQGGCPALMQWLANEVGVAVDVQVFLTNAFIFSTDCQPCETAARLKRAATILADVDGSYMAAMNQVFNPNVPFTPEMANSLASDPGAQYASAREYIDALVQYIAILNTEMGSPVADSVAYVMTKYGSGITGSGNEDMSTFVASRLESGETYGQ
jgi:hypothetical protein